ncbi:MAG: endonuclease [Bacteroidales bacterium]|nr:endonuclease [Bacteroidales bacterium]MBQ6307841.1 endonuclease [Bacteroidales bacterium]
MKRLLFVVVACAWVVSAIAQPPANYYNAANGLTGDQLKVALHNIIKGHTSISYSQIWNAFWSTDNKGNGVVWDMYSDRPNGTPPYTYALGQDQCGSYNSEGDCYNREHSWPQSWFNDQSTPRTDMHHIFATDGYVNNRRSNYPFGEVGSASWTSQNGSKLGSCKTPGYSGTVFEPIDAYKGDFARAIMYMSVRYYGEDSGWGSSDMTSKSVIKPWAIALLLRWNKQDPVSQKEIDRNNAIYNDYQHNRNPFVDHPEYADMIWDPSWTLEENQEQAHADGMVVYDLTGRKLFQSNINNEEEAIASMKSKLKQGCYMLLLLDGNRVVTRRKLLVN